MHSRSLARVVLLVVAVVAVTLSCSIDYWMDFAITDVAYSIGGDTVTVSYSMTNRGTRDMDNAAIDILVSINSGAQSRDYWTADSVDLAANDTVSGTLTFTFTGYSISDATAIVVGSRWDAHVITE